VVCISGASVSAFGSGLDPHELVRSTAHEAIADAGLTLDDVDALVVANAAAEAFLDVGNVAVWTATEAGLADTPSVRVDTGPSSGLAALSTAIGLNASGQADTVLALGFEAMTSISTDAATRVLGKLMHETERELGLTLPGLVAMMTSAYLDQHPISPRRLAELSVRAHALAAQTPHAQFQNRITVDDVLGSRTVAEPLRLLHCAPLTDGAAGLVVSDEGPVDVSGIAQATDRLAYADRRTPPERFDATRRAAQSLFERVDHDRSDVDVIELHDAFTPLLAINLEDLGFAKREHGIEHFDPPPLEADPVVNPAGGLKARGHPVGATGLAQLVEVYDQLVGRAANQAPDARVGLAHNIGGFGNNVYTALLEEAGA
jgi:acetyl-CoA acetyltransferase